VLLPERVPPRFVFGISLLDGRRLRTHTRLNLADATGVLMASVIHAPNLLQRFNMLLLGLLAALALILAAVGIYGMMAYRVGQRMHEIGIHIALGAQRGDVLRLVLGDGAKLTFFGIAIGIAGAIVLSRVMKSLLFEVKPTDPATFSLVMILLAIVALAACYIPARRAMRLDPMVALRYE